MINKKIVFMTIVLSSFVWFVGCSNDSSPVSITENTAETVAALSDIKLWEVKACGSSVWGLSQERPSGSQANWCIYQYNTNTQKWTKSTHFGMEIATTPSGRVYHTNNGLGSGIHQIWWGTMNSNGQIPTPAGMTTIMDIGAGRVGMKDHIWAIFGNGSSTYYIYVYQYVNGTPQWTNMTKDLNNSGSYLHRLSVDPYNGNTVAVKKNDGRVYVLTSLNGSWVSQSTPSRVVEVAIRGTKIAYHAYKEDLPRYRIYTGIVNGSYSGPVATDGTEWSMGMDGSYIYYIGPDERAKRITY
ncbi:MAG: hypothetical protein JW915_19175 [Chitinispirillaceae bacterium]|nr:hypothetical protein [Chitinispirillaceae bacterium]